MRFKPPSAFFFARTKGCETITVGYPEEEYLSKTEKQMYEYEKRKKETPTTHLNELGCRQQNKNEILAKNSIDKSKILTNKMVHNIFKDYNFY